MTFDIGPGEKIWIAAGSCPGMVVAVNVARGVGLKVGVGVSDGERTGLRAMAVSVAELLAASAVKAMTVGRYSGGYAVGMGLAGGAAHAVRNPKVRSAIVYRFIQSDSSTSPTVFCRPVGLVRRNGLLDEFTICKSHYTSRSDSGHRAPV